MKTQEKLRYLEDRWDERVADALDEAQLLRYRSNLLGSDLRITNFGGGNTSSKTIDPDPLDGSPKHVLWIKGSGGDIGTIQRKGFAALYLEKLHALAGRYRGVHTEDEMVDLYPLCAFGNNTVAASIDTPLHAFLPFKHVDHLHPDWGIALAAAANGREKMEEFNRTYGHKLIWLPWQRPGFELAMMLRDAVKQTADCDGIVLGGHGLFTWGDTQRECYLNTITIIDQLGQFVSEHLERRGANLFGGNRAATLENHLSLAQEIFPFVRGRVSAKQRLIGYFSALSEVLRFVNSVDARELAHLGTSCPDHFIRTKIRPLFVPWSPQANLSGLREAVDRALQQYREEYAAYYVSFAHSDSPKMRDANPTVVLVPGMGMFSFGKNKAEARITGEFYTNAIHVMEGASALGSGTTPAVVSQAGPAAKTEAFSVFSNYVALPPSEAFRIEYWQLEEAKIRQQPPEKELSRQICLVVGGANGVGRETVLLAADRGAHVVVADKDFEAAKAVASETQKISGKESAIAVAIDIRDRTSIRQALLETVAMYGGLDIIVNTAEHVRPGGVIERGNLNIARDEMDIRYFGMMRLAQAFGPALRFRGADGVNSASAFVNLLSVHALMNWPAYGSYSAAEAACLSAAQCMRAELRPGGVKVMNVFFGPLETEWFQTVPPPKLAPAALANAVIRGLQRGLEDVFVGDIADDVRARLAVNPKALEREMAS